MTKDCILFKTYFLSPELMDRYHLIKYTSGMDTYMCIDSNRVSKEQIEQYSLSNNEVLLFRANDYIEKGYPFVRKQNDETDIADNQDFVLCDFYERYNNYNNYWSCDNDVFINGNVGEFLKIFKNIDCDLIAGDMYTNSKREDVKNKLTYAPGNWWFSNFNKITKELEFDYNAVFFGALYRVSNRAIKKLLQYYSSGIGTVVNEVRIPTILEYENVCKNKNYTFYDFKKEPICKNYIYGHAFHSKSGFLWLKPNKYHTVKQWKFKKNNWYHPIKIDIPKI